MFEQIGFVGHLSGKVNAKIPADMYIDVDDMNSQPISYTMTQATTGTWELDADAENGVLSLDCNSTTETQGIQAQKTLASFLPKAGRNIWFEARVKVTGIANLNAELFIGLAEIDTTVIAASAVSTANHLGFSSVTDDCILLANAEKAGTGATTTGVTIKADTWYRFGFKVSGLTSVSFYVNDAYVSALPTANIPIVVLAPTFVCQSGGTDQPVLHVDYVICQQTR
uniref:SO2946-like C-terminal domain-containing protein n=1 Tax=viral metagenome TaxID=1070528 RepID=A0A6M3XGL9_9ZZZZ